jgi:hypothetical protein
MKSDYTYDGEQRCPHKDCFSCPYPDCQYEADDAIDDFADLIADSGLSAEDKTRSKRHQYYIKNRDRILKRVAEYKRKNPQKRHEQYLRYYARNKAAIIAKTKAYKQRKREEKCLSATLRENA